MSAATRGTAVRLEDLRRSYGDVRALDGLSLEIAPGEMVALLGPSGCGKTTALRGLAGLEDLDGGRVVVDGQDVTHVPANRRDMGMVFQAYSLFPHLTALENVAFGLRMRRVSTAERRRRAAEALDLVGLAALADRYAAEMSGGQQQRVALARALAIRPRVLLLDEPLSALDARVRAQLREEIRRIQVEVGTTAVFVTHDQEEALAVADRVGVLQSGRLEQIDAPEALYSRPATGFVAEFVGLTSRVRGTARGDVAVCAGGDVPLLPGSPRSGEVDVLVRPEAVVLRAASDGAGSGPGAVQADGGRDAGAAGDGRWGRGHVVSSSFLGALVRVTVTTQEGRPLVGQLAAADAAAFEPGAPVAWRRAGVAALAVPAA